MKSDFFVEQLARILVEQVKKTPLVHITEKEKFILVVKKTLVFPRAYVSYAT